MAIPKYHGAIVVMVGEEETWLRFSLRRLPKLLYQLQLLGAEQKLPFGAITSALCH